MTRFLGLAIFAMAIAISLSYPVEELPREAALSEKAAEPVVDAKPEPEVHEPVPADQGSSELPKDEPQKDEPQKDEPQQDVPQSVEERSKKDELVSFESFDADKSGYIEPEEWKLKAEESKKDKFSQVDVNGDSRISPEEYRDLPLPADPQEVASDEKVPADVSSKPQGDQPVDQLVDSRADDESAPIGRSAVADAAEGEVPKSVVADPVQKEPVEDEASKSQVIVEPVPAASAQDTVAVADEAISPKSAVPKPEGDDASVEGEVKSGVAGLDEQSLRFPEIRSDSAPEDVDDRVPEQKDPILSDEVKSEEVKSDEVKSEEVKSDEVKSDEVKSDESRSDGSRSEEPKSELPRSEEAKQEEVKSEVAKPEEVKSEEVKPVEEKPQEEEKKVELRSEDVKKEDDKPELAKAPVEEAEKPKEEDKVKEEVKDVEPVQSDEPSKVSEEVKKVEVAKDSSSSSQVRV